TGTIAFTTISLPQPASPSIAAAAMPASAPSRRHIISSSNPRWQSRPAAAKRRVDFASSRRSGRHASMFAPPRPLRTARESPDATAFAPYMPAGVRPESRFIETESQLQQALTPAAPIRYPVLVEIESQLQQTPDGGIVVPRRHGVSTLKAW